MLTGAFSRAALAGLFLVLAAGAEAGEPVEAPGTAWTLAHAQARRVVDELRSEVEAMKRIAAAQKELMEWNGERARLGLTPVTLRPELCLKDGIGRWCGLLPATFGAGEEGLR